MAISDLITAAFREGNLIPIGTSPTTAEQTEALDRLNALVASLLGFEFGVQMEEWPIIPPQRKASVAAQYPLAPGRPDLPSDVYPYPPANMRLMSNITTPFTVYFPEVLHDGSRMGAVNVGSSATLTLNGNGRLIDGAATATFASGDSPKEWFYRADLGQWKMISTLGLSDASPFPNTYDDLLTCGLIKRLAPRFGKDVSQHIIETYADAVRQGNAQYRQPTAVLASAAELIRSRQSYSIFSDHMGWFNPLQR